MRWCASPLWSPTDHRGGPGFRCWRQSASSPRSNSSPLAQPPRFGPRMPATSLVARPTSWPYGTAPGSGRLTTGSLSNWPTCAPRFGGPPTRVTSTSRPPSRRTRRSWRRVVKIYEPIAWAEEASQPAARSSAIPGSAFLYAMAALCWMVGRVEAAVGYADAAQRVIDSGGGQMPFGIEGLLGATYLAIGQPERSVEWSRAQLAHGRDTHAFTRASLVLALTLAGSNDEAMAAANGLIDATEATRNPWALSFALFAHGFALPRRRSRPRTGRPAPRPGDCPGQRQSRQRVIPGDQSGSSRGQIRRSIGCTQARHSRDPQPA